MEFSQLPYIFIINYIKQFFNHEDFTKAIRFICMQHLINLLRTPYDVRTLKPPIIPNKKAPEGAVFKNGAGDGSLLELFGEKLLPIVTAPIFLLLNNDIENYFKMQGNM